MSLTFYQYDKTKYPETEKYIASREKRQLIKDFLDFANDRNAYLTREVEYAEHSFTHVLVDESNLLDGFFEINQQKMEEERAEMLKELKGEN